MLFDIHTHSLREESALVSDEGVTAVFNCFPSDALPPQAPCSVGLHPWHVGSDWEEQISLVRSHANKANVWAIGECGIDKLRGGDISLQERAFEAQVAIAHEVGKPVVVHCVKAVDEILRIIGSNPDVTFILHGFRGKPQQAQQIIAKGAYLSFGYHYNVETLRFVFSLNRPFFLETDDLHLSVRQIYDQVAHHLGVDVSRLVRLCDPRQTFGRL